MRVLALDFGSLTGWAVGDRTGVKASGTWDIAPKRGESPGIRYMRLRKNAAEVVFGSQTEDAVDRERLAWAAGFFDGEGCFYNRRLKDASPGYSEAAISIGQKDPEVLRKFAEIVSDGNVTGPRKSGTSKVTGEDILIYDYTVSGLQRVRRIVGLLWPWLGSVKRRQAETVLEKKLAGMQHIPPPGEDWVIFYEMSHHRGGAATEYAAGCVAAVQEFCAKYGFQHRSVHSATLKKYATGKGNAKKPDMMAAAKAKGWAFADDNEADALWILDYALSEIA